MFRKKQNHDSEQKNWYKDKYQFVLVQRNLLAVVTLICLMAALFAVYAVKHFAPLKTVEPFIIQVDKKSGITEVVDPVSRRELGVQETLDNYFVWKYVLARETYSPSDMRRNQNVVRVLSDAKEYDTYRVQTNPRSNPNSPAALLGNKGARYLKDPTIVYLSEKGRNVAQVHFTMEQRSEYTVTNLPKIATVEYAYFDRMQLKREERLINPMGFQVLRYRVDEAAANKEGR